MSGLILPAAAAGTAVIGIAVWMRMIAAVQLGQSRWVVNSLFGAGAAIGLLALTQSPGAIGIALAGTTVAFSAIYFGLLSISGQSSQAPNFAVGSPIPDFTALDHNGEPFTLSSLDGKPMLIKFFRGHW
jgi:cytochrome oxidase Cu insertion factor (SCO1/SenC/PrrC family)